MITKTITLESRKVESTSPQERLPGSKVQKAGCEWMAEVRHIGKMINIHAVMRDTGCGWALNSYVSQCQSQVPDSLSAHYAADYIIFDVGPWSTGQGRSRSYIQPGQRQWYRPSSPWKWGVSQILYAQRRLFGFLSRHQFFKKKKQRRPYLGLITEASRHWCEKGLPRLSGIDVISGHQSFDGLPMLVLLGQTFYISPSGLVLWPSFFSTILTWTLLFFLSIPKFPYDFQRNQEGFL